MKSEPQKYISIKIIKWENQYEDIFIFEKGTIFNVIINEHPIHQDVEYNIYNNNNYIITLFESQMVDMMISFSEYRDMRINEILEL